MLSDFPLDLPFLLHSPFIHRGLKSLCSPGPLWFEVQNTWKVSAGNNKNIPLEAGQCLDRHTLPLQLLGPKNTLSKLLMLLILCASTYCSLGITDSARLTRKNWIQLLNLQCWRCLWHWNSLWPPQLIKMPQQNWDLWLRQAQCDTRNILLHEQSHLQVQGVA